MKYPILLASLSIALPFSALAGTLVWTGDVDSVWNTDSGPGNTNWDTNALPGTTDTVQFGATGVTAITLGGVNQTVASMNFLSTASAYTFDTDANKIIVGGVTVAAGSADQSVTGSGAAMMASGTTTTFNIGGTTTFTISQLDFNNTNITKSGTGTLKLGATGDVSSNLTISAGTVELTSDVGVTGPTSGLSTLTGSGTLTASGGTRTVNVISFSGTTFSGTIESTINLVKGRTNNNDAGAMTLSGNNTYSGTTTIYTGAVRVNGTHTGGDDYFVNGRIGNSSSAGILSGTGSIVLADNTKTFYIGDGSAGGGSGILYPGGTTLDTSTLTLGSSEINTTVIFNTDGVLRVDLGAAGASDRVDIFGDLDLSATGDTLDLKSISGAFVGDQTYTIVTFTGTRTGIFDTVLGLDSLYQVNYLANSITVGLAAIPEPSTYATLAGLAIFGCAAARRRRA